MLSISAGISVEDLVHYIYNYEKNEMLYDLIKKDFTANTCKGFANVFSSKEAAPFALVFAEGLMKQGYTEDFSAYMIDRFTGCAGQISCVQEALAVCPKVLAPYLENIEKELYVDPCNSYVASHLRLSECRHYGVQALAFGAAFRAAVKEDPSLISKYSDIDASAIALGSCTDTDKNCAMQFIDECERAVVDGAHFEPEDDPIDIRI